LRTNRSAAIASVEDRNDVYRRLLSALSLSNAHRANLRGRGFTDAAITDRRYRTLSLRGRARICREIAQDDREAFVGVPGFYIKTERGRSWWTIAGSPGLLIPVVDAHGRINALQIRQYGADASRKYSWLSSANKPNGVGSGAPCHVSRPLGPISDGRLWITEGPLKADLAADHLGALVVAVPGVGAWRRGLQMASKVRPKRGRLVVAYDADAEQNKHVRLHRDDLIRAAAGQGWDVRVAEWGGNVAKGIDDAFSCGAKVNVRPVQVLTRIVPHQRRRLLPRQSIMIGEGR